LRKTLSIMALAFFMGIVTFLGAVCHRDLHFSARIIATCDF
jgi:hypothetical protein